VGRLQDEYDNLKYVHDITEKDLKYQVSLHTKIHEVTQKASFHEPMEDGGNTFMTKIKEEDSKSVAARNAGLPPVKLPGGGTENQDFFILNNSSQRSLG
jgi:hypothetical protein